MANVKKNNDYLQTRNNLQQYDLVTIFKNAEIRTMRHTNVATLALVQNVDEDGYVFCIPYPIRDGESATTIKVWNMFNIEVAKNDSVLVVFTDRDYRLNVNNVSEKNIVSTNDSALHKMEYGIIIGGIGNNSSNNDEVNDLKKQIASMQSTITNLENQINEINNKIPNLDLLLSYTENN